MCRNWHTRQTQNLLSAMACGFESHHRHHESGSQNLYFKRFGSHFHFALVGRACTADSVPGQKLGYGKISSQPWSSRSWWTKQRWCWRAPRSRSTSTPVGLKRGLSRGNRTEQGRLDHESPCGNGWAWESIALFTLQREPKWYLHGTGSVGAFWFEWQTHTGR